MVVGGVGFCNIKLLQYNKFSKYLVARHEVNVRVVGYILYF